MPHLTDKFKNYREKQIFMKTKNKKKHNGLRPKEGRENRLTIKSFVTGSKNAICV